MKRYQVSGAQRVLGHEPGTVFEADLSPAQEARLLERGSIVISGATEDKRTRAELNEAALAAGVEGPDGLPNKQAVIDAIDAAANDDNKE